MADCGRKTSPHFSHGSWLYNTLISAGVSIEMKIKSNKSNKKLESKKNYLSLA